MKEEAKRKEEENKKEKDEIRAKQTQMIKLLKYGVKHIARDRGLKSQQTSPKLTVK